MLMQKEWGGRKFDKKIKALQKRKELPQELVAIVTRVMQRQIEANEKATVSVPSQEMMADSEQVRQGKPLIGRENFPVDRSQAKALFEEFMDMVQEMPPVDQAVSRLKEEVGSGDISVDQALDAFIAGNDDYFKKMEAKTPSAPRCLNFLVQSSLTPGLWKGASLLKEHLPEELSWPQGYCPLCGSPPLIGELREKEGIRILSCSFCHFEYRAMRLACPFCGEKEAGKLEYFESQDEPGFRVEVCNTCKYYIKTIDYRKLDRNAIPILEDLLSLPFDIVAQNKGFTRPTLSAWGF